jgi:hypothetical protein
MKKIIAIVAIAVFSFAAPFAAGAAGAIVVTSVDIQGWSTADTRPGGAVSFVVDATAPSGSGALRLTTDATTTAKAQYMHGEQIALDDVTELSYSTKQVSAAFAGGDPSYQLPVFLNGTAGFTTFVYEPYQNGSVSNNVWQSWDVDSGQFWSTRTVTCSNGGVVAGGGGAPFYTLSQIKIMCPDAMVLGFGVNIGSNNPSYDVETDLVSFNGTAYDFEPVLSPSDKESCKDGGWMTFNAPAFENQGQCVSYVNHQ